MTRLGATGFPVPRVHGHCEDSIAAIFRGTKGRVIRGTAASAEAHERAKAFPELAALALEQTR